LISEIDAEYEKMAYTGIYGCLDYCEAYLLIPKISYYHGKIQSLAQRFFDGCRFLPMAHVPLGAANALLEA
jgi:hypothetical protein